MIVTPLWALWWVWVAAGVALAILELFISGYVFLGFAVGASVTGLLLALGLLGSSLPGLLLVFALLSVLAWVTLRRLLGIRRGQVKRFDSDINENY